MEHNFVPLRIKSPRRLHTDHQEFKAIKCFIAGRKEKKKENYYMYVDQITECGY